MILNKFKYYIGIMSWFRDIPLHLAPSLLDPALDPADKIEATRWPRPQPINSASRQDRASRQYKRARSRMR